MEKRLEKLIGKEVISFKVNDFCDVEIKFKDGTVLSFNNWSPRDDIPDFEDIKVELPKEKEKQEEQE